MTRLEAIDKLCESYSVYFDVERFEENEDLLMLLMPMMLND